MRHLDKKSTHNLLVRVTHLRGDCIMSSSSIDFACWPKLEKTSKQTQKPRSSHLFTLLAFFAGMVLKLSCRMGAQSRVLSMRRVLIWVANVKQFPNWNERLCFSFSWIISLNDCVGVASSSAWSLFHERLREESGNVKSHSRLWCGRTRNWTDGNGFKLNVELSCSLWYFAQSTTLFTKQQCFFPHSTLDNTAELSVCELERLTY